MRSEADYTDTTNTQLNAIEVDNFEDPLTEIISASTTGAICAEILQTEVNDAEVTLHTEKNTTGRMNVSDELFKFLFNERGNFKSVDEQFVQIFLIQIFC